MRAFSSRSSAFLIDSEEEDRFDIEALCPGELDHWVGAVADWSGFDECADAAFPVLPMKLNEFNRAVYGEGNLLYREPKAVADWMDWSEVFIGVC